MSSRNKKARGIIVIARCACGVTTAVDELPDGNLDPKMCPVCQGALEKDERVPHVTVVEKDGR